jgi:hypothetical protein
MKKFYIGLLLSVTLIGVSCQNHSKECEVPCPLAMIYMVMKVKIVSKITGADLLLSSNSPYKPSDLNVTSSINGPNFHFNVDTTDTNNRSVLLPDWSSQGYVLQLANLNADNIKVVVGTNGAKCCASPEVKSIALNDSLICAPCNPQQEVVIRK